MTPVPFVKTTESFEVLLAVQFFSVFHWSSSIGEPWYPSSRLRNHMGFGDQAYWVVHLPERTKTGEPNYRIGSEYAGRAQLQ